MDRTTILRQAEAWPAPLVVRLHVKGLESLRVSAGAVELEGSVPSTGDHRTSWVLHAGAEEKRLDAASPYWADIRLVAAKPRVPLEDGYFQLTLPPAILEGNPAELHLAWIDFYR